MRNSVILFCMTWMALLCNPILANHRVKQVIDFFEQQKKYAQHNTDFSWRQEFGKWQDGIYKNYLELRQCQINFDELADAMEAGGEFKSTLDHWMATVRDFESYGEALQIVPLQQDRLLRAIGAVRCVENNEKLITRLLSDYNHENFCLTHVARGATYSIDAYSAYDRIDVSHIQKPKQYNLHGPIASDAKSAEIAAGTAMTTATAGGCAAGTVFPIIGNIVGCAVGAGVAVIAGPLTSLIVTAIENGKEEDRYYNDLRRTFAQQDAEIAEADKWARANPILNTEFLKFGAAYCADNAAFSGQVNAFSQEISAKTKRDIKSDNQERLKQLKLRVSQLETFFDQLFLTILES